MRILALTNLYPNPYQPQRATFNRSEFCALAKLHSLTVISPIAWTDELAVRRRSEVSLPPDRRVRLDGLTVDHPRYLFTPKLLRSWYGHFYRFSIKPAFERALAEFCPDIIYAQWAYPDGWAAVELGHAAGLPVVIKVHGSDILVLSRYRGRRLRTIQALQRADGIIAVSQDLARHVVSLVPPPEKVHVVYSGIDRDVFQPGSMTEARKRLSLPPEVPIILFVGNLLPVKGLDVLIEACSLLKKDVPHYQCLLIGQGHLRVRLDRQIKQLGLRDNVKLLGPRPNVELPDWYRAATLLVLPSRSEGLPTVLREAAACGTPFVGTRVGGIPEIARFTSSRLVRPEAPGELAQAIREMVAAPARRDLSPETLSFLPDHDESAAELTGILQKIMLRHGARTTFGNLTRNPRELASCVGRGA